MTYVDTKWSTPRPIRLRVEDYVRLSDAGALASYAKTELVEGIIVAMNAQHAPHSAAKYRLAKRVEEAMAPLGLEVLPEVGVRLSDESLVEPDICVFEGPVPRGDVVVATVRLVVEVADSTTAFDLGQKSRLYASAGVAEYWVVDLPKRHVRAFADPNVDGSWSRRLDVPFGEALAPLTLPALTIDTAGLG